MFEPILQWRKLSGDTSKNYASRKKNAGTRETIANKSFCQVKVSKQDRVNEEAKLRRKQRDATKKKDQVAAIRENDERRHIVQQRKAQYSHLISTQRVLAKDEDQCPIVYSAAEKGQERKEVAALWLQPFTVIDDY